ncbi:hypothetical protein LINGRAHAP2_LOCUS31260, partial [Linum grandiflorum]
LFYNEGRADSSFPLSSNSQTSLNSLKNPTPVARVFTLNPKDTVLFEFRSSLLFVDFFPHFTQKRTETRNSENPYSSSLRIST